MAIELVETIVPMCAMLRRSLSSEAAASLITALTRAASAMGSLRPPSNQRVACAAPPRSFASSRMIREETMSAPIAALAIVLAITIRARSSASGGRSVTLVLARNRASSPAMLIREYGRSAGLSQRVQQCALPAQALRTLLSEPLHPGDHVRLGAAGEPHVVLVGGEGVLIGQRADVAQRPHAARSAHHEHEVLAGLGGQHGVPVSFGLAVEQLFADRRDDLHVDAGPRQPRQHAHEIERRARSLGHDVAVAGLAGREVADDVETLGGGP